MSPIVVRVRAASIFDCSQVPEDQRSDIDNGKIWVEGRHQTLEQLNQLSTSQPRTAPQG